LDLSSLDDFRTLFVKKLVAAIGAEKLDVLVPELLPVTIKLAFAMWAGHPENFGHGFVSRIFSRQDAKAQSLGVKRILKIWFYLGVFAPLREIFLFGFFSR
jgi:hypothetical protein